MAQQSTEASKKRPLEAAEDDGLQQEAKRRRSEDENLDDAVSEIVAVIEDSKKMLGLPAMFPEHAPRSIHFY